MGRDLPQKYSEGLFVKIKNFFKSLFAPHTELQQEKLEDNSKLNLKKEKNVDNTNDIKELQMKYECGEILASNMSDEQYKSLSKLYSEQIKNLKINIAAKESKLNRSII